MELIEQICQQFSEPCFWRDANGRYKSANPLFLNKYSPNQITTTDVNLYQPQSPVFTQQCLVDSSGNKKNFRVKETPLFENNKLCGVLCLIDHADQFNLPNYLDTLPCNIYWKDTQGRYIGLNNAATELVYAVMGKKSEIIGLDDTHFLADELASVIMSNDQHVIKTGQTLHCEERIILHDGTERIYITNKMPLHDKNNNIIGVLGASIDISKQKAVEKALLESKSKIEFEHNRTAIYLQSIIDNLPDHVFWEDTEGNLLGCNEQQAKSFGYANNKNIIGRNIAELGREMGWSEAMIATVRKNDELVIRQGQTIIAEEPLIYADGEMHTMYSKKAPLKDMRGKIVGMIGLAFDITERKQIEENLRQAKEKAETANIAKSNFIANISHDLRTPLHAILGTAELMQIREHAPEQDEMIEAILHSGQGLLKLIENILNYSESEATSHMAGTDRFDLRYLIETVVVEQTHRAEQKNVDLIISYSDFVPHFVIGHAQNIRRIVTNLLENAIKFTEKGHIIVSVECLDIQNDYADLQISVEDTGMGISKVDIDHICERFYRASPSYINKHKGTGLGLSIIKQLTESMGGNLRIHSQENYGSTFCCTIPFRLTEDSVQPDELKLQFDGARILIIDDHRHRRLSLLKQFPGQNVTAVDSRNAFSTFDAAEKINEPFNLIVMDENVENSSPEKLAIKIRESSSLPLAPLLVLCRKINGVRATEEQKKLFQQILKKPLAPSDLATHLAPSWQRWTDSYKRKSHAPHDKKLKVLLVEDDLLIQKFTSALLVDSGCEVDVAGTGRLALEKSRNEYDLVLMDIGLPDIDGLTATKQLRMATKNSSKKPIIVALTAHVSDEDKNNCLSAGLDDFLKKPASYNDFQQLLRRHF